MATSEILKFSETNTGTNLLTQLEYDADIQRTTGNQPGVARLKLVNKALKQSTLISATVAKFIADNQLTNVVDTLTEAQLSAMFGEALLDFASTQYAPIASPTFTGTVLGITKAMVGLGSVDDTSDLDKPISNAAQTALDLKASLTGATFTGQIKGIAPASVDDLTRKDYVDTAVSTAKSTVVFSGSASTVPTSILVEDGVYVINFRDDEADFNSRQGYSVTYIHNTSLAGILRSSVVNLYSNAYCEAVKQNGATSLTFLAYTSTGAGVSTAGFLFSSVTKIN